MRGVTGFEGSKSVAFAQAVAGMPSMRELRVADTVVGDEAVAVLTTARQLARLDLG